MGLLDIMLGNASTANTGKVAEELQPILAPGEKVEGAYKLVRDLIVFTDRRLILVNKQGLTGNKQEITSLPWRSLRAFTFENAGMLDTDSEVTLYVSGGMPPLVLKVGRGVDIREIGRILATYTLG